MKVQTIESLEAPMRALVVAARSVARAAYVPYSRFPVGSAVLAESGEIFAGCNVENASFGLTMCAERVAIGQAVSAGHRRIVAVAVYTDTPSGTTPCGACRQVIFEFGPDCTIISAYRGNGGSIALDVYRAADLLPHGFGPGDLTRG